MKPRISWLGSGRWECSDGAVSMCGDSPADAWELWSLLVLVRSGALAAASMSPDLAAGGREGVR